MSNSKLLAFLLMSLIMFLCLFGCGGGSSQSAQTSQSTQTPPVTTGTAVLAWNKVTTYTDGSSVSVSGYYIYYGPAHNNYTQIIPIPVANLSDPNSPKYTVTNLQPGTYYFAVSAYDSNKVEGAQSAEVSKIIQ